METVFDGIGLGLLAIFFVWIVWYVRKLKKRELATNRWCDASDELIQWKRQHSLIHPKD